MSIRRIFDAHVHVERGLDTYDLADTVKNLIFNEVATYKALSQTYRTPNDVLSLVLDLGAEAAFVREEVASGRVSAVKIHSRIQRIGKLDWPLVMDRLSSIHPRVPVIVDAFYFGQDLEHQPSLGALIELLVHFPDRRFIVAHSGGYKILEYFFHLREFSNCYYELALSLQYLEDSSIFDDLKKLVRHTPPSRILFGSDFPFASPAGQQRTLENLCLELGISESEVDKIFYRNAYELFRKEPAK